MHTREPPRAFYLVMRLHQLVAECLEEALVPVGITASQYTVLSVVRRHAPITSAELARRLRISAQSTGESVKALETHSLIERYGIEENRRVLVLRVTSAGDRLLARANKLVGEAEERFFAALTESERESLVTVIRRLREAAAPR